MGASLPIAVLMLNVLGGFRCHVMKSKLHWPAMLATGLWQPQPQQIGYKKASRLAKPLARV
jgi:hypothetical protein